MVFGVLTQLLRLICYISMNYIYIYMYMYVSHELESFKRFCMFTHRKKAEVVQDFETINRTGINSSESLTLSMCRIVLRAYAAKPFFTS